MKKTQSFADFLKSKDAPATQAVFTRPAATQSRIVLLKRRADGTIIERSAAPAFLFRDHNSFGQKYILPKDHFWRGSPDHLARKAELEKEKGAN
ncbi:hypothetical protein [Neorhizobium tomejilense]|uniref:hypothetical protein n=1 Tax=Neorhizobium tomejilense TaxID=2093828 RepID=UPI003ECC2153